MANGFPRLRRGRKTKTLSAQTGKKTVFSKRNRCCNFGEVWLCGCTTTHTQRWPILGIFGVSQMANRVGTIYFGHESAKAMPLALQTFINIHMNISENKVSKKYITVARSRKGKAVGHRQIWPFEACISHAQSRDSGLKCSYQCSRETGKHSLYII